MPIMFAKEMILFGTIVESGLKGDGQDDASVKIGTENVSENKSPYHEGKGWRRSHILIYRCYER
ncbi:hypothetical protein A8F97_08945 [Pectobacterium parmentieri]|nr:hypothetical protein A8F97_08945 [Pectobacterium parmentieri]